MGATTYTVTTTAESGAGSLKEAIDATGERIVNFSVAGDIKPAVATTQLTILNPGIQINFGSAPGKGVQLRYYRFNVNTDHVILDGLVSVPGGDTVETTNALTVNGNAHDVWIKNSFFAYGADTNIEIYQTSGYDSMYHLRMEDNIIALGLNLNQTPPNGRALLFSRSSGVSPTLDFIFARNLVALCYTRGIEMVGGAGANLENWTAEIVNNLFWGINLCPTFYYAWKALRFENNVIEHSSEATNTTRDVRMYPDSQANVDYSHIYASGNIGKNYDGLGSEREAILESRNGYTHDYEVTTALYLAGQAMPTASVKASVLANAGPANRTNALVQYVIDQVTAGTGLQIDTPADTGIGVDGWDDLTV